MRFDDEPFRGISRYLQRPFQQTALEDLAKELAAVLRLGFTPKLRGVPSAEFTLAVEGVGDPPPLSADNTIVFALDQLDLEQAAELQQKAEIARREGRLTGAWVSVDLPTTLADAWWCPQEGSFPLFGQRDLALARINAAAAATKGALGDGVNVVIVDQGIDRAVLQHRFPGLKFRGGWIVDEYGRGGPPGPPRPVQPGAWPDGHGTRMAEMVLSVAPKANIFDLPLLPSHIVDLGGYLAWAAGIYWNFHSLIPWLKRHPRFSGPWVLCNAWAVFDLSNDPPLPSPFNYGQNPENGLNLAVSLLPSRGLADVVFAAGNCGQFCPDTRCGAGQVGPDRSIYGVAAIDNVLSVTAVRCDDVWLGYSSQGGSPANFGSTKPDLCAPSQFAGPVDWGRGYIGTSTACALTTGALAAARSFPATQNLSPAALHARALASTSPLLGGTVPSQHGSGLLNVDALL
jgi:hypothetical protein